jgi:hypothetical protein
MARSLFARSGRQSALLVQCGSEQTASAVASSIGRRSEASPQTCRRADPRPASRTARSPSRTARSPFRHGALDDRQRAWPCGTPARGRGDRINAGYVGSWHCTSFAALQQNPTLSRALQTCRRPGGGPGTRAYDPVRTSGHESSCVIRSIQPSQSWYRLPSA